GVMQPFQRTAAVFDIDDSLLDGNAGTIFTWFLYSNREMVPSVRSAVPRALYEYARKRLSEADMVALGSKCQMGIRADRLRELARRCFGRHAALRRGRPPGGGESQARLPLRGAAARMGSGGVERTLEDRGARGRADRR